MRLSTSSAAEELRTVFRQLFIEVERVWTGGTADEKPG